MKGRPVEELVYEYMFPKPRPSDPQNFTALLQRHLVLEVRQEVHSFYGHLDTPEAKYPGLDYTHPTHRMRLSRWQWHRRLFRAFDGLRLTPNEIALMTKWEGTKWAKERYEKEQGITILDTTEDDISQPRLASESPEPEQPETAESGEIVDETMAEDSDEELASVGVDLNERLRERVALRNSSGDLSMVMDEEWERWLKEAIETGALPEIASRIYMESDTPELATRLLNAGASLRVRERRAATATTAAAESASAPSAAPSENMRPYDMLTAAREGRWEDIPESRRGQMRGYMRARNDHGQVPVNTTAAHASPSALRSRWAPSPSPLASTADEVSTESTELPQRRQQRWLDIHRPNGDVEVLPGAGWLGLLPGA